LFRHLAIWRAGKFAVEDQRVLGLQKAEIVVCIVGWSYSMLRRKNQFHTSSFYSRQVSNDGEPEWNVIIDEVCFIIGCRVMLDGDDSGMREMVKREALYILFFSPEDIYIFRTAELLFST
jgi:hypothetical protein